MAGPFLNLTVFQKSTPHTLRALCLASFPPGFLILLIHGCVSGDVNPAIGTIPLFFSAAFAALLLANEKQCGCQASGLTGTPLHLVLDLGIGCGLLVCLILTWVFLNDTVMLGTYGTNFLGCNFLIHLYFVCKQLQEFLTSGPSYPMSCPHCVHSAFSVGNFTFSSGLKDGYAPLLDTRGEPRASVEEGRVNEVESVV